MSTVLIIVDSAAWRRWLLWSQHVWRGWPWRRSWPDIDYCRRALAGWRLGYWLIGQLAQLSAMRPGHLGSV
jgi:hypothetical protein